MANYVEDLAEPLGISEALEADILKSVTEAISGLAPDEVQALKNAISKLYPSTPAEGKHPVTKTLQATLTGTVAVPAENALTQIVGAVPKLGPLLPKLEAAFKDVSRAVLVALIAGYIQRAVFPPPTGSTTINNYNTTIMISTPAPAFSPLAQAVLDELRKIGGAVSREVVLAATPLSPKDVDLGLAELVQAGIVIEAAPGVFTEG